MSQTRDPCALITPDWRISGALYRDREVFDLEMERIFSRCWLYLAHESEVDEPGDYKATWAGTQPVIVARGADDGVVRAMFNRCRHRGSLVCQREYGNASHFRCPYHGWTYKNTGELRGLTYDDGYQDLDRASLGLVQLPRVDAFAGFVFGSLAAQGPSLREYLGNAAPYLELVASQGPEGIDLSAGAHRLAYDGNWKLQVENTIDNYHFGFVHRSFLDILGDRLGEPPPIVHNIYHRPDWRTLDLGNGHSAHEFGDPRGGSNLAQIGDLPFNLIVFPNLCFVGAQLRHVLPRGAARTEVRLHPLLHRGAGQDVNASILRAHEGFYGPAGFGGTDDMEIAFSRVTEGLQARGNDWLLMSRGLHRERPGPDGVLVGHASDELPQRAFYRQWLRQMAEAGDGRER